MLRRRALTGSLAALAIVATMLGCKDKKTVIITSGATTISGVVTPAAGLAPGVTVLVHLLNDDGQIVLTLGGGFTDAMGNFSFTLGNSVTPGARYLVEAKAASVLFSYLTSTSGLVVTPVTTGVYDVVTLIVRTQNGRSVDHYTAAEIDQITTQAASDLALAGTDLSDRTAVRNQIITDTGGLIADLSEGQFAAEDKPAPVAVDPPDVDVASGTSINLNDGGGELWDIQSDGSINDGTSDSYDGMFRLWIDGTQFPGQGSAVEQDSREFVLGPSTLSSLDVTRKIYVDDVVAGVSFCRFTEILVNPTGGDITVTVLIEGNLGSDEGNMNVNSSSDGNTTADNGDQWLTNHQDGSDPALGFLFPGADTVVKSDDDVEYQWTGVTVPAGATVTIIHWAFQNTGAQPGAVQEIHDLLNSFGTTNPVPPDAYFNGLTIAEALASFNPYGGPGVYGGAGSVGPLSTVTVTNVTTGEVIVRTAATDGSFSAIFVAMGATTGDSITVTATDGTNANLVFP